MFLWPSNYLLVCYWVIPVSAHYVFPSFLDSTQPSHCLCRASVLLLLLFCPFFWVALFLTWCSHLELNRFSGVFLLVSCSEPSYGFCLPSLLKHVSTLLFRYLLIYILRYLSLKFALIIFVPYYPASCKMGTGSFPGVKCGRGVLLTTHPLLVLRSWNSRAIPLPTLWATPGL